MAVVSKPVMYGLTVMCAGALIYYFQAGDPPVAKTKNLLAKAKNATQAASTDFLREDFETRFDRIGKTPKNIFLSPPVEHAPSTSFVAMTGPTDKVPAPLAEGDGNWIFTGIAVVDDRKMGLLENSAKHSAEYVTEGKTWKNSRIRRISSEGIAFVPKEGGMEQVVLRYSPANPSLAPLPPASGPSQSPNSANQPINPAMFGPIGPMPAPRGFRSSPITIQRISQ